MKRKQWILGIACIAAGFSFAGCGNRAAKQQVCILDGQTETRLLVKEGVTVKQALAEAEISIGKKDVVEPSQDSVISEDITKISIDRFAKVSVAAEGQTKEFTLTGGKVGDAIDAAEIELKEDDSVSHDLDAYLTDGMRIEVVHNPSPDNTIGSKGKESDSAKGEEKQDNASGSGSERRIVSKEKIYDCDGSGHGYYSITWSDGSVEYEDF